MAVWAASQSAWRALAAPSFQDAPCARRRATRLAHPGIETQVADELACRGEALDVADHRDQGGGADQVDAGDRHQPADLRRVQGVAGDGLLEVGYLAAEEVEHAQAALHRLALIGG
jgi:hypothetical protein